MRDLLSKLDAIVNETSLNPNDPKADYNAKKKALDDLEKDGKTDKSAIQQRRLDLDKEAESKGVKEDTVFEIGDEFGISFSEDHEISTTIVDILEDGIVVELDDTALEMLTNEGVRFFEGELVEGKDKGTGGRACWKGYRRVGANDCKKMGEDTVDESGLQYHTGVKKHGKEYMTKAAAAGRDGASQKELGALKDKYSKAYKEDSVAEGSAHGYNVARYFAKYQDQRKITNWLRTNAGLDKTAPVYFDDADLVYGDQTIVPDALINPKYKMSDLLDAVKQAASGMAEGSEDNMDEAEYQGRKVQLGKKMAGDVKKSKVYVKNPQGNVVKVNFGDKKMKIKKSNPARRKSFRARHNCSNPGPRHKARYWSCRSW